LAERGYDFRPETDLRRDLEVLAGGVTTLVVNDVLDTNEQDILTQRSLGFKVVTIEDLGPGARFADWVVNALYPPQLDQSERVACGARFATLRDEFLHLPPKDVRSTPTRVLLTFGGTDPACLAARCARLLTSGMGLEVRVIIGPGGTAAGLPEGVVVVHKIRSMATEMAEADLILTSAGRTVYEAAATGTPVVVLAQNAREATHTHIGYDCGVVFLGIGPLVEDHRIVDVVSRLLSDHHLRVELSQRLRRSIDSAGATRIGHQIRALMRGLDA
jgi:spore coat polysaccharide biosynthesis predicted glycosyltransferase SpsG